MTKRQYNDMKQAVPVRSRMDVFQKILNCVSDTAAAEVRIVYKAGFKVGAALKKVIQKYYFWAARFFGLPVYCY